MKFKMTKMERRVYNESMIVGMLLGAIPLILLLVIGVPGVVIGIAGFTLSYATPPVTMRVMSRRARRLLGRP